MTPIMLLVMVIKAPMGELSSPISSPGTTTITTRQSVSTSTIEPATTIITTVDAGIMSGGFHAISTLINMIAFTFACAVTGPI